MPTASSVGTAHRPEVGSPGGVGHPKRSPPTPAPTVLCGRGEEVDTPV